MSTTSRAYPVHQLQDRTVDDHYTVTAGVAASAVAFTNQSKALLIVNEGANPARVRLDGRTATTTIGVLINAGASYSIEHFRTESISVIRTGAVDTTLRIQVIY